MTMQIPENLWYQGEEHCFRETPLKQFEEMGGKIPHSGILCSALWRGYVGTWEVRDDRFYLIGIDTTLFDGRGLVLNDYFPGFPDRVFAHWYTGTICVPQGEVIRTGRPMFFPTHEQDLFLTFERGRLIDRKIRVNGVANPNLPGVDADE